MRRKLRYASVSVVFVPIGQVLLQLIVAFGFDGSDSGRDNALANVMVATILSPPYYVASRRFVWGLRSSSQVTRDAAVFWTMAVGGVIASSATLWLAAILFPTSDDVWRGIRVLIASLSGTGVFWVIRYLLADRWLFKEP